MKLVSMILIASLLAAPVAGAMKKPCTGCTTAQKCDKKGFWARNGQFIVGAAVFAGGVILGANLKKCCDQNDPPPRKGRC